MQGLQKPVLGNIYRASKRRHLLHVSPALGGTGSQNFEQNFAW